ncbi:hypothetical protein [Kitasatospora sp. NPDC057198]
MVRTLAKYTFGAIFLYLVVNYASGTGTVISKGAAGGVDVIKTLQGR